jgi:S-adenosylmethionine:diacylglycerol 3-amino-3-carboxypropyl transferase
VDYSRAIANSGAAERCFVTTFYEFVYSKAPDVQADGCQLEQMRVSVNEEGGSLKELLLRVPASKQFRLKRVSQ